MSSISEIALQESAALFRFVDSVIRRCSEVHQHPVYTKTSETFLTYVRTLGNETKQFLEAFPRSIEKDQDTVRSKRKKLNSIRSGWETIHEYLQSTLEADTLHIPTSLILAFQDAINKIPHLKRLKFTVFHSDQVNYIQLPPGAVKEAADNLADVIKGTRFPLNLGLIGMPYSQSGGFFLNCLLAHEMAHVAYQEVFSPEIETEIERVLENLEKEVGALDDYEMSQALDTLEYWIEEIFCDLFAICIIGPAYSFALIEIYGATLLVDTPDSVQDPFHSFMQYHPAEITRFHIHLLFYKKLGWWKWMEQMSTAYVDVLRVSERKSSNVRIESTIIPQRVGDDRFLKCFWEISAWLMDYTITHAPSPKRLIADCERQSDVICQYFRRAIVPSTIVIKGKKFYPSPVVLINTAFRFYLEKSADAY